MYVSGRIRLNIITHIIAQLESLKNTLGRLERTGVYIE